MNQSIFRILDLLGRTLDTDWTVEAMASCAQLSPAYFRRLFKKETGKTPAKYLHDLRLDRAYELLADPLNVDPIKQIRYSVGLKSDSHFTNDFKTKFGSTPTESRLAAYAKYQSEIENGKK